MSVVVTNTLTGEREPFEPIDPDSVLLYFCGLTVSDDPHLGHARAWVHVDGMHRWLEHRGYTVRHVENFTDVNEKIVARVGDVGADEAAVARTFIDRTLSAMRSLNLKRALVYPRVSEHIPEIIDLIETLLERGYAYESAGSVYFDVTAFDGYGKLSNQDLDAIESEDPDPDKRHPADFALWKAGGVAPDDLAEHRSGPVPDDPPSGQTWDAPWGTGRPGWHIECSAMSMAHLGETIDIHVGGQDLVFPHHENEIAQSEAATGECFARYWMHVRLLETEGEKMSSSLENYFTVANAIDEFGANRIRMFLLSTAYTSRQTYSEATLEEAVDRWDRLERAHERAIGALDGPDAMTKVTDESLRSAVTGASQDFAAGLDDDFNTRVGIAALLDLAGAINRHVDDGPPYDYRGLRRAVETVESLGGDVLGFELGATVEPQVEVVEDLVELVLAVRESARERGNYERADELRSALLDLDIVVEDGDDGATWRFDR